MVILPARYPCRTTTGASIQKFDADLLVRTPCHAAVAARRGFQRQINVEVVGNSARIGDRETCALVGFVHDDAFLDLLALCGGKPSAAAHRHASMNALILRFLCGCNEGHRRYGPPFTSPMRAPGAAAHSVPALVPSPGR